MLIRIMLSEALKHWFGGAGKDYGKSEKPH